MDGSIGESNRKQSTTLSVTARWRCFLFLSFSVHIVSHESAEIRQPRWLHGGGRIRGSNNRDHFSATTRTRGIVLHNCIVAVGPVSQPGEQAFLVKEVAATVGFAKCDPLVVLKFQQTNGTALVGLVVLVASYYFMRRSVFGGKFLFQLICWHHILFAEPFHAQSVVYTTQVFHRYKPLPL